MEVPVTIIFLGGLIFFTHFFNSIFDKTRIPNALLLLVIGLIVGPIAGLVKTEHFGFVGPVFTSITLIILLFESGVNLNIKSLGKAIVPASLITLFNFIGTVIAATVAAYYFSPIDDWISAAFFGAIIGGTSSAVVIPIVKQLKMNPFGGTVLLLESALSDVLCLVTGLGLLSAMRKGIFDAVSLLSIVSLSFFISAIIGIVTGLIWSVILSGIRKLQNYSFTNLAIVFVVAGLTDLIGLNGGIAALSFGIALGNAYILRQFSLGDFVQTEDLLESEKNFFSEIVFIFQTYFFVYVGVSIKFGNPLIFLLGLLILIAILFIRPFSIKFFVRTAIPTKDYSFMSVMSPKGLVPAILASIPFQLGLNGGEIIQDLAYSVVLLSIVACAILVIILSKMKNSPGPYRFLFSKKSQLTASTEEINLTSHSSKEAGEAGAEEE